MPWKVVKRGSKWQVVNKETGRVMGTHDSKEKARAQQSALYVHVPESRRK
jgi:hypothetical protein